MTIKQKAKTNKTKLIPTQALFVKEYIRWNGNGRKAYLAVFPKTKPHTADQSASRLLNNVKVMDAIRAEYVKIFKEKDLEAEKANIYQSLRMISDAYLCDAIDIEGGEFTVKDFKDIPPECLYAMQGADSSESNSDTGNSKRVTIKLQDKLKALEMRAKIIKLIDPKSDVAQIEITIKKPVRPEVTPEIEQ